MATISVTVNDTAEAFFLEQAGPGTFGIIVDSALPNSRLIGRPVIVGSEVAIILTVQNDTCTVDLSLDMKRFKMRRLRPGESFTVQG